MLDLLLLQLLLPRSFLKTIWLVDLTSKAYLDWLSVNFVWKQTKCWFRSHEIRVNAVLSSFVFVPLADALQHVPRWLQSWNLTREGLIISLLYSDWRCHVLPVTELTSLLNITAKTISLRELSCYPRWQSLTCIRGWLFPQIFFQGIVHFCCFSKAGLLKSSDV